MLVLVVVPPGVVLESLTPEIEFIEAEPSIMFFSARTELVPVTGRPY